MNRNCLTAALLLACATLARAEDNVLTLAGGIAGAARYSGADDYVIGPLVGIDYQMANGFYASTMRGIGYGQAVGPVHLSAALGYRGERAEKNRNGVGGASGSPALRGMGDVKGGTTAVLGASWSVVDGLELELHTELPLSHRENGRALGVGLTGTLFQQERDHVTMSLAAKLGDRDYMQTYYGVSAQQSARSGYRAYRPNAGLHEMELTMTWRHQFDKRWGMTATAGVVTLVRDAAASPISKKDRSATGALFATYSF
ncbi:outer membrane scaffolding protein for murein synthesis (MipA/OmpV family) [Pseudoduganella flava]|uniref:MipA/OmpV family protein n=1 Tax=Pseudoduganella flava TaxID=871742 RepID=A0A562Q089_9BURK|nr:MipA/OmpV family protein [Pseudoduganella flava]QGZ38355.1 MipA/OmpV family protein [Pseudoduganella flava]TWI50101.1 outer membrane scaffolding protein for murein synthesis (MipA/OmpV family) [Pseudoduganella flava]